MNRFLILFFVLLVIMGLGIGMTLANWIASRQPIVSLTPIHLEIPGKVAEPDLVQGAFILKNRGPFVITVLDAVGSCGCMEIAVESEHSKGFPLHLLPGATATIGASIATSNRIGKQETHLVVSYKIGDGPVLNLRGFVNYDVQAAWRSFPYEIVATDLVDGEARDEFVGLYDAFPDPGLAIGEIYNPRPDLVSVAVTKGNDEHTPSTLTLDDSQKLTRRYSVKLRLLAPKSEHETSVHIILTPKEPGRPRIVLPVVLQKSSKEITLRPDRITLTAADAKTERRYSILCQTKNMAAEDIRVQPLEAGGVKVLEKATLGPNEKLYEVVIEKQERSSTANAQISFTAGDATAFLVIESITDISPHIDNDPQGPKDP